MHPDVLDYLLKALAELLGTGIYVFVGCMICVFGLTESENSSLLLNISVGFGLALQLAVSTFGCITQAHINPAITLAFAILRLIPLPLAAVYVVAQCVGAILGFGLLIVLTPVYQHNDHGGLCTTVVHPKISLVEGFFVEVVITGLLIWVVCATYHPRNAHNFDSMPIRLGCTVWVLGVAAIPYTGASMNPARSTAPAIWNNYYKNLWLYWLAPLLGSAIAATSYKYAFINNAPSLPCVKIGECFSGGDALKL